MHQLEADLRQATTAELPALASDAIKRAVECSGVCCSFRHGRILSLMPSHGWLRDAPFERLHALLASVSGEAESELLRAMSTLSQRPRAAEVSRPFHGACLLKSRFYEQVLRPCSLEPCLVTFPLIDGEPIACLTIFRGKGERPFSDRDRRRFREVATVVAASYVSKEPAYDACWTVPWMLDTLGNQSLRLFSVIFNQDGQPLWLSDEAIGRLGLSCATLGTERLLLRGSPRLLRLWRVVQVRQQSWQRRPQRLSGPDFLASGERLAVGSLGGAEGLVLAVLTRAAASGSGELSPPSCRTARLLSAKGLSRRELEVASMAMRGYSVPNMAALLGVRESTVRTFIKRVYAKLEVRNRAELCFAVLEPLGEE